MNQKLKDAIMDAVYVPLERDDMQTPCTLPFMTSSEYGVCDGDGCPVSDETIASALNAVAKIQTEYYKVKKEVKKETQKETQKEMTAEASPRPWMFCPTYGPKRPNSFIVDADGGNVALICHFANEEEENRIGNLIVDAVNERETLFADIKITNAELKQRTEERGRLRDLVKRFADYAETYHSLGVQGKSLVAEARAAIGEEAK